MNMQILLSLVSDQRLEREWFPKKRALRLKTEQSPSVTCQVWVFRGALSKLKGLIWWNKHDCCFTALWDSDHYEPNSCLRKLRRVRAPEQQPRDLLYLQSSRNGPFNTLFPIVWFETSNMGGSAFGGSTTQLKSEPFIHTKHEWIIPSCQDSVCVCVFLCSTLLARWHHEIRCFNMFPVFNVKGRMWRFT